jgi:hypothetical protein
MAQMGYTLIACLGYIPIFWNFHRHYHELVSPEDCARFWACDGELKA